LVQSSVFLLLLLNVTGGGYEIAELLMQDVTGDKFAALAGRLVFGPLGMTDSRFAHPLTGGPAAQAADGHTAAGMPLEGRWHNYPEQAAAGLWTTPSDLLRMAASLRESWRKGGFLPQELARQI
jgi:CubicO group peptidase (beta-lactamase class C family)